MAKLKSDPSGDEVSRVRLPNGATLLVKETRSNPVVSLNLWIEAGSIDEKPNERGMAHLIEHMIFKGTKSRGVGQISREVEGAGGYLNAFTSFEHTCFYVVLPKQQIRKAMDVEFDAYFNSMFDAMELEKEKEVVFEEMRMRRDDPWSWSWEMMFKTLYKKCPYRWPVIGDPEILKKVPRESLLRYYQTHYVSKNTVVAVVGDVKTKDVIRWTREMFRKGATLPVPPRRFQKEPEPSGLQARWEEGDIQQTYVSLGFPSVSLFEPDAPALEVLDSVLGDGNSSRLNISVREQKQSADEVGTDHFLGKYGGAFVVQGLTDQKRLEPFLRDIMAEARKIYDQGVSEGELAKVKNKLRASKIFEKQSVDGQAKSLGFWELLGDYRKEEEYLKALESVTSDDLRRAARKYLHPSRASLVVYHPRGQKGKSSPARLQTLLTKSFSEAGRAARPRLSMDSSTQKITLANGSTLLLRPRKNLPIASLGVFLRGGFADETENNFGITHLMTKCLSKGTQQKSHEELSGKIEGLAAQLDPFMEKDFWGISLEVLSSRFEEAFGLLGEVLLEPAFAEEEVLKEKKIQLASIRRLKDDPSEYTMLQSDVLTFKDTPYAHMPVGSEKSVSGMTTLDVKGWHAKYLDPFQMTWVAVGDIEAGLLVRLLNKKMPGISNKGTSPSKVPPQQGPLFASLEETIDSQQTNIVLGLRAPDLKSKDYFNFRVLNTMLSGMGGKLFAELREKRSLAYSVHASHDAAALGGAYQIYLGCSPDKTESARKGLEEVLQNFAENPISETDLKRAKTYMVGLFWVGLQSNRSQLYALGQYHLSGMGMETLDKFPKIIEAITSKELGETAKKYLLSDQRTWVVVGPKTSGRK